MWEEKDFLSPANYSVVHSDGLLVIRLQPTEMVTCHWLHYWIIILLCKACKLGSQCLLPTLTGPRTVANLTSHITIEQTESEYYLSVFKFSHVLLSASYHFFGLFVCFTIQSKGNLEEIIYLNSKTFLNFSTIKHIF